MGAAQSTALTTTSNVPIASTLVTSSASVRTSCPSVSTTTITTYSSTTNVFASTSTSTIPVYPNVESVYINSVSTAFESPLATTVSSTTYKNTTIVVVPPQTVVTVPTPSGFTPVQCEASWVQPTVSSTGVLTRTYTETAYSESTDLNTVTSTGTLITSVSTSTIPTTVTVTATVAATTASTSTRNDATSTVYDACASNNVVQLVPDGQFIYNVDLLPTIDQELVTAIDEYDCCALCQANSTCVGSIYLAKYIFGDLGSKRCDLLFRNDRVCDPTYSGANVTAKAISNEYSQTFISNSGCGQILYQPDLY